MRDQVIQVIPVSGGWSVQCTATDNPLMYVSGAKAEQAAKALGACLARLGHDVEVQVHDRHDVLVGTAYYYAVLPHASLGDSGKLQHSL